MRHARVLRQPNRGATLAAVDEAAIKRAAKGTIEFVRNGNFLAILGDDESCARCRRFSRRQSRHLAKRREPAPLQQEANWLLQRPSIDRVIGAPEPADAQGRERFEATYTKPLHRARLGVAVLRARALQRRPSHGVDALPGRLSPARRARAHAQARRLRHHRASRAGRRLLRPQRRRRRRRRRRHHRHAEAGRAGARALAARGGIRLRAEGACHGREGARAGRLRRQAVRLDRRNLERHACRPAGPRQSRCSAARRCPIPCPCRRRATCRKPVAAAPRAMPSRSTTSPPSASSIIWCRRRRCASPRCAGSAPCRTCSRSNAPSTNWPSAPARTRSPIACRSRPIRAPAR